jgi:hypothetical protein
MKTLEQIGIHELKELLIKNWMTHDAMWFAHCASALGMEKTNELNRAAIKSLAAIEIQRAKEVHGIDIGRVSTFAQLQEIIDAGFRVSIADFIRFTYDYPAKNIIRWQWEPHGCFAYRGLKRLGAIEHYRCGVMYRVLCWLEHLGVPYSLSVPVDACLMRTDGACAGEIRVSLS